MLHSQFSNQRNLCEVKVFIYENNSYRHVAACIAHLNTKLEAEFFYDFQDWIKGFLYYFSVTYQCGGFMISIFSYHNIYS